MAEELSKDEQRMSTLYSPAVYEIEGTIPDNVSSEYRTTGGGQCGSPSEITLALARYVYELKDDGTGTPDSIECGAHATCALTLYAGAFLVSLCTEWTFLQRRTYAVSMRKRTPS